MPFSSPHVATCPPTPAYGLTTWQRTQWSGAMVARPGSAGERAAIHHDRPVDDVARSSGSVSQDDRWPNCVVWLRSSLSHTEKLACELLHLANTGVCRIPGC